MNTIVLMGRLARDPETKLTSTQKGQTKVSRFPLVVKRNRTSKAFVVMITAYGNNAEFVEKYLEKGIKIALSGELVMDCMKIAKIILSIITMLFAVLGLVKILSFDIANPIMLVSFCHSFYY